MYLTFKYLISVVKYTQSDLACKLKRNTDGWKERDAKDFLVKKQIKYELLLAFDHIYVFKADLPISLIIYSY